MFKVLFVFLLSTSLYSQTFNCAKKSEDLFYNMWVLNHHIEYNHKEEIKTSKLLLKESVDSYSKDCIKDGEFSEKEIEKMKKFLRN